MRILRSPYIMSLVIFLVFGTVGAFAQESDPFTQLGLVQASPDLGQGQGGDQGQGGVEGQGQVLDQGQVSDQGQGNEFGPIQGPGNGPQGSHIPPGPSGYCSDNQYLYVIGQGKIYQYNLFDLILQAVVDLPEPPAEAPDPSETLDPSQNGAFPHKFDGPSGVFIKGSFLYILHHGVILQYTVPNLFLQNIVEPTE